MALCWLGGAGLLAAIAGVLLGRESVFFFYVALPFALGGVVAHVVAAVWPARDHCGGRFRRLWTAVGVARVVLGLAVGVLGFGFGVAYGTDHQVWFGERVTAEVTDTREVCGVDTGCHTRYRLSAAGDDLGWVRLCGANGRVGTRVEVDVDPLRWVPPLSPACTAERSSAPVVTTLWLGGVGTIALVIVVDLAWGVVRPASRRSEDPNRPEPD